MEGVVGEFIDEVIGMLLIVQKFVKTAAYFIVK